MSKWRISTVKNGNVVAGGSIIEHVIISSFSLVVLILKIISNLHFPSRTCISLIAMLIFTALTFTLTYD